MSVAAFAAAALTAITVAAAPAPAAAPAAASPPPPADWMATVFADRADTTLSAIVIPGTHDSGAYAIDVTPPCDITPIAGTDAATVAGARANPCVAADLARAQDRSLADQLADGIRYLDLRVGVPADRVLTRRQAVRKAPRLTADRAAKVPLVLQHTFVSVRLRTALAEIVRFAVAHPREQVLLDIQHVDLTGDPKVDAYYTKALDLVLRRYQVDGTTVCSRAWSSAAVDVPDAKLGTGVTLAQAWAANRNLLVLKADGELPTRSCYRSREQALWSPWPNTEDPAASVTANEGYLASRRAALTGQEPCSADGGNRCGLFVDQLQLSAQLMTQVGCLTNSRTTDCSLAALAAKVNDGVVGRMSAWRAQGLPVNIAIVDYYDRSAPAYAAGLIALNQG